MRYKSGLRPSIPSTVAAVAADVVSDVGGVSDFVALMRKMWNQIPSERPTAKFVADALADMLDAYLKSKTCAAVTTAIMSSTTATTATAQNNNYYYANTISLFSNRRK